MVVQRFGTVQRYADEEMMLCQEPAPVIIKQRAIGLQCVVDVLARTGVSALKGHRAFKKRHAGQRRFAALPPDRDALSHVRQKAGEQRFERFISHSAYATEELMAWQIIAVRAIQITLRADGLDHQRTSVRL